MFIDMYPLTSDITSMQDGLSEHFLQMLAYQQKHEKHWR